MGFIYAMMMIQGVYSIYASFRGLSYNEPFRIGNTTSAFSTYLFLIELALGVFLVFGVYGLYKNSRPFYYIIRGCYYFLFYYYIFMVLYVFKSTGRVGAKVPAYVIGGIFICYCYFAQYYIKVKKGSSQNS